MIASRCTINIHTSRKLSGKSREEIIEAVLRSFRDKFEAVAVQQCIDVVRVTFGSEEAAVEALKEKGVRLLGIWCRIDGGPPTTIVHLFDFPQSPILRFSLAPDLLISLLKGHLPGWCVFRVLFAMCGTGANQ